MKKILYCIAILFSINTAQAQMNEMIGVLGINAAINNGAHRGMGQMQNALSRMQLQQDITLLVSEIQNTFMHDYQHINTSLLNFNGFRGIKWDVVPVSSAEFYIILQDIDAASCSIVKSNPWNANRIEINDGQGCQNTSNSVKLYF